MSRRLVALVVLGALALLACRKEQVALATSTEELLRAKADETVASMLRQPDSPPFAAIVVFRSDVFIYQSAMLDRLNVSVLDSFDNVAVLQLDRAVTPSLLAEDSVRKVRYLCKPMLLVRFHPTFLLSVLRLFAEDKENRPITFFVTFRNPPADKDIKAVRDAGYTILSREGPVLSVSGPPSGFPRLLASEPVMYYDGATKLRTL